MCCALVWVAQRLRQYVLYHTTWLIAKLDPIKFIFEKPSLSGRIARWQVLLSEFDILYVSQKAIKGSVIADFLAERANEEYEPMSFDFPDEDLMAVLQIEKKESPEKDVLRWSIECLGMRCGNCTNITRREPLSIHSKIEL